MEEDIQKIAESIHRLIKSEISSQRSQKDDEKRDFEDFIFEIRDLIRHARELSADYKEQGLTYNTIEAEGYLRAFLTVEALINEYEVN